MSFRYVLSKDPVAATDDNIAEELEIYGMGRKAQLDPRTGTNNILATTNCLPGLTVVSGPHSETDYVTEAGTL